MNNEAQSKENGITRICQNCGEEIPLDYHGSCPHCGREGSNYKVVCITEVCTAIESTKVRAKKNGEKKWYKEMINRYRPSGDPKLPKGVIEERIIDRLDDKYDQVVRNRETGEITHEEHMALTKHNHNKKQKKDKEAES